MIINQTMPTVHSMYWNNIDPAVLNGQKQVFDALSIPLNQHRANRVQHGDWMDAIVENQPEDAVIIFCDIDAFPITRSAYEFAVGVAAQGSLFGLAQFSNHKPSEDLYVGPMFMAFSKRLWREVGSPSFKRTKTCDAGELLTMAARAHNITIHLVYPTSCLAPKWALKDRGLFGIGTFYGNCEFFHLFESRDPKHEALFSQVVNDIVFHRPLHFSDYLKTMQEYSKPVKSIWSMLFRR